MSEPNSMFTMHWFREYSHAFNPNDYTAESSVQLPLEIYQKHYINADQCTVLIPETFLKPDWLQCDMIWELPYDIPENLIVLRTWHGNKIFPKRIHE